jgi:cystathionine beta-lyase family protein involved in aluminum resistance
MLGRDEAFIELAAERLAATGTGEDDKAGAVFNQSFGKRRCLRANGIFLSPHLGSWRG